MHITIDYVDMVSPVRGMRYMVVIVDQFSSWVEAVLTKVQNTANVLKFLTREVMPMFEIPSIISSDKGTAFVQTALRVAILLRTRWKLGCVYHLQSQGIVE